jgi:hypothetical protein
MIQNIKHHKNCAYTKGSGFAPAPLAHRNTTRCQCGAQIKIECAGCGALIWEAPNHAAVCILAQPHAA